MWRENELRLLLKNLRVISKNFHMKLDKKGNKYEIQLNDYYWWFTKTIPSKFVIRYRMTQLNFNHGRGQMRCRIDSKYTGEAI